MELTVANSRLKTSLRPAAQREARTGTTSRVGAVDKPARTRKRIEVLG